MKCARTKFWLWRAVDPDRLVFNVLVQSRCNTKAVKRLMQKLMQGQAHSPRVMITDKLRFYDAARRDIMPSSRISENRAQYSRRWSDGTPSSTRSFMTPPAMAR
ncbi:DDE-type integrase/transposase/recombinase [Falsochrobactrum sp. TDYN1]|uniref:DDE-type integrase/transposase/recombinase n=1 Tax=Falsochrobactrum tianjinense TaxID=2706015 RepID=A0A949PP61_9HYPH|nr:DDE-type integrase/transposase/recombinase [Falsochrobactrum sp. TDYN1]